MFYLNVRLISPPRSPKSLVVIIKRSRESHFENPNVRVSLIIDTCLIRTLPNQVLAVRMNLLDYRGPIFKSVKRRRVASSVSPVRKYTYVQGDVSKVMWTIITDSICNFDYVNIYKQDDLLTLKFVLQLSVYKQAITGCIIVVHTRFLINQVNLTFSLLTRLMPKKRKFIQKDL